jgi:hypothetical protein
MLRPARAWRPLGNFPALRGNGSRARGVVATKGRSGCKFGLRLSDWIPTGEKPGLQTRTAATESVSFVIAAAISVALFFLGRYTAGNKSVAAAPNQLPAKSIAALPFENLSRDPDNAYFADGIQDEILTRLSKIANLKVISRTSTQKYKSAPNNLLAVAPIRRATRKKA